MGEIQFENLFVDGTKIEANANKYSFVWKKSTNKYQARLSKKIKNFIEYINRKYGYSFTEENTLNDIYKVLIRKADGIEFVHGKGKRKTEIQRQIELLEQFIKTQAKYESYNKTFKGRNSFSKTDPDATFMHIKDDHMRNAQLKPGYNLQIGVESQYIVGMDISSERSDTLTLIPFMERLESNLSRKFERIIADAGYESEENYTYFENKDGQTCFIKPTNYERSKTGKFKSNMNLREKITSELGIKLRVNRSIQVEGAFGVLKWDYNFKRFLLRGERKVRTEVLLAGLGYNINKLHNKIQNNSCGSHLFEPKSA